MFKRRHANGAPEVGPTTIVTRVIRPVSNIDVTTARSVKKLQLLSLFRFAS